MSHLRSWSGQAGFTLLELVVVAAIIGAITVPLSLYFINGMRSYSVIDNQTNNATELAILSGKITSVIRGATAITTAADNSLTFQAYAKTTDTVVSQYRYFVSGNNLNVGITPASGSAPNYTFPSANEVVKTLRSDLSMSGAPVFTYFDDSNNQLTGTINSDSVNQIGVYLSVNPNTIQFKNAITTTSQVTLRNLKTNL